MVQSVKTRVKPATQHADNAVDSLVDVVVDSLINHLISFELADTTNLGTLAQQIVSRVLGTAAAIDGDLDNVVTLASLTSRAGTRLDAAEQKFKFLSGASGGFASVVKDYERRLQFIEHLASVTPGGVTIRRATPKDRGFVLSYAQTETQPVRNIVDALDSHMLDFYRERYMLLTDNFEEDNDE